MKNLLLWYLPQAVLFCLGTWGAIDNTRLGLAPLAGAILAGMYTASVIIIRDAPSNWRGLTSRWKRVMIGGGVALYGVFAFLCHRLAPPFYNVVFLTPLLIPLWLIGLAFANSLTALRGHDGQSSRDCLSLTGAGGRLPEASQQAKRIRVGK